VLQLRVHPALRALREQPMRERTDVELTYITARGRWYDVSWKGSLEKSGGLALNIGVHFFDLLIWLYGQPLRSTVFLSRRDKMSGVFELERARVRWYLSVDGEDLPPGKTAVRSLVADGREVDLSDKLDELHTAVYRDILAGGGYGIADVQASIQLAYAIRTAPVESATTDAHPRLLK
jgi:UDP-N-acetyl-2-amino-2-deoxyglucuronate dehydrogenase